MGQLRFLETALEAQNRVTLGHFGGDWHVWKGGFQSFHGTLKGGFFVAGIGDSQKRGNGF